MSAIEQPFLIPDQRCFKWHSFIILTIKYYMATNNTGDLTDSKADQQKMAGETIMMDMPDVQNIPGQEHVRPPKMREFADTTISSADEEGEEILAAVNTGEDDEDLDETGADDDANVSEEEIALLDEPFDPAYEDEAGVRKAGLDNTDDDGEPLNEGGFSDDRTGEDLDVPGSGMDDYDEEIGEEDEENNNYSLGDNK